MPANERHPDVAAARTWIEACAGELGFDAVGVANVDLEQAGQALKTWLAQGFHGEMQWMARHGSRRWRPAELVPGTVRVVSVRLDYLPEEQDAARALLDHPRKAYVSRYALGRDYHKIMRPRLQRLADAVAAHIGTFGYRAFVDSAPVMEKPLAEQAGLGWIGKHTNLIHRDRGSWFFLGELYTDLPLVPDAPSTDHCGSCRACIDVCPTDAIVAPYRLDARRCISYLTIEHSGSIPPALRAATGNRIYGCDDCQLFCPWNKFARRTTEPDFAPRHGLDDIDLAELAHWSEDDWLARTAGSAIRRIGFQRWRRNLAVGLGNATDPDPRIDDALARLAASGDALITEHAHWGQARRARHRSTA